MSYKTTDELNHFDFEDACISEMRMGTGTFSLLADNVKILPDNSCNRDIRTMRTNQLFLKISDAVIDTFVEEGYKVYDANGRLLREEKDHTLASSDYKHFFSELEGCSIDAIIKNGNRYEISISAEDHTFFLALTGTSDTEEWERFLNV